ncbi:MAG: cupin domain-containing protein [Pseudomonadota bacterium]|nr:cupin domain-containing protein [Pseudomonadota bacterium]
MSRRHILAATAAGGVLTAAVSRAAEIGNPDAPPQGPQAIRNNPASGSDPGPRNPALGAEFPASEMPPSTDHGDVANFWFPFAEANKRVQDGGWARQVTVKDLPIATTLAGVDMRLTAGGIREMHWHKPAEWAFVLYGRARITGFDQEGHSFVADVGEGDLWNFPSGIPHSIQGLEPDGTEFLLVFDDGAFSEFSTFLPTSWTAHTPVEVLAKNFGLPASTFSPMPTHERYIFQAKPPGPLTADQQAARGPRGMVQQAFNYSLLKQPPNFKSKGGGVRIVDQSNFPAASTIAAAHVTVHPGGLRELHWHPNADEWQYYISGQARMTVFAAGDNARTKDFHAGDVGYIPRSMGHYIENTGNTTWCFWRSSGAAATPTSRSRSGWHTCRRRW